MAVNLLNYVFDDAGNALAGATVVAVGRDAGGTHTTTTNASGQWSFTGLPDDTYDVTITLGSKVRRQLGDVKLQLGGFADTAGAAPIGDGTITTAKLADDAVTQAKVAAGAIGATELASNAVTSTKLAAGSVGSTALASDAVTAAKIADGAVGTSALADGSVTAAKLAADAGAGGSASLADGSVTTAKLANLAVTTAKLAADAVTNAQIASRTIHGDNIAFNAITSSELASGSVGNTELADNAVTAAKMSSNSVGTSELVDGSVTAAKLAADVGGGDLTAEVSSVPGTDLGISTSSGAPTQLATISNVGAGDWLVFGSASFSVGSGAPEVTLELFIGGIVDTVVAVGKGASDVVNLTQIWFVQGATSTTDLALKAYASGAGAIAKADTCRIAALRISS